MFKRFPIKFALLGLLALTAMGSVGCQHTKTDDEDNLSERPWNRPKSWEHGLPAGLTEGR